MVRNQISILNISTMRYFSKKPKNEYHESTTFTRDPFGSVRSSGDDINIRVDGSTNIHGTLSAYDRLKVRSGSLEVFGGGLV